MHAHIIATDFIRLNIKEIENITAANIPHTIDVP